MSEQQSYDQRGVISCKGAKTEYWFAWLNTQPPGPKSLHVVGEVEVPNPGVRATLTKHVPQGINPDILLLDLHLIQEPGVWPQITVKVPAQYQETPAQVDYTNVNILCDGEVIADFKVEQVS